MKAYRCILADPPWQFDDRGSRIAPDHAGHYETMSLAEIIGLAPMIQKLAARNAHLWLWAPNSFVVSGDAQQVARLWGFEPKQMATWCKDRLGMGHWMRNTTEQILFCLKGRLGSESLAVRTHFYAKASRHSEKPEESYAQIEMVSPGPRVELFARRARPFWDSWGDEAPERTRIDLHEEDPCFSVKNCK